MNDEIKEILEFKENADYKKLSCDEIKVLRDYITNLQQKIKHYEETTTFGDYVKELNLLVDYKSRIDKAIELLQDFDYLDKIDCFCEPTKVLNILRGKDND